MKFAGLFHGPGQGRNPLASADTGEPGAMKILWSRDSICMGDDCNAPNAKTEEIDRPITVSDLLDKAADYVPNVSGAVWAVWTEGILAGFLEMSTSGYLLRDEPVLNGTLLLKAQTFPRLQPAPLHVHCTLYTTSNFWCGKGADGRPLAEQFPPYTSLLDMVKSLLREQAGCGQTEGP